MADPIVANVVVSMPSQLFTMPREFKSVFNGKIYIGKIDTDPTIPANQIQVYLENEDGSLVPMPQPIRTNGGGYPVYNGKVSKFVTVEGHSMLIQDANGVQLFYFPNVLKYDPDRLRQEIENPDGATLYPNLQVARWRDDGDVRGWGAVGDGVTDDAPAIQAALNGGNKKVYIPSGTYLIKRTLQIFKNTNLVMDADTVILNDSVVEWAFANGEIGNPAYSFGYDGDGNITITGGIVDNRIKQAALVNSSAIAFAHGDNIKIINVTFKNNYSSHFVEINSSRNVVISGCTFDNLIAPTPGSRECINVDWSSAGGFPAFGGYDGTVCDDVLITGCTFINGDLAVGSHGKPSDAIPEHNNIRFVDNHIENMGSGAIGCQFWKNAVVSGNTIKNCAGRNIICWGSQNTVINDNQIFGSLFSVGIVIDDNSGRVSSGISAVGNNISGGQSIGAFGIRVEDSSRVLLSSNLIQGSPDQAIIIGTGCRDVSVLSNQIIGAAQRTGVNEVIAVSSMYVTIRGNSITKGNYPVAALDGIVLGPQAANTDVSGNTILDVTRYRINVNAALSGIIIDEAYLFSIPTNSVVTVPMDNVIGQGVFSITSSSSLNSVINGTVWARGTTGNAAIKVLVKPAGDQWGAQTGVLTGTTGAAGFMTVSAADNRKLYIENRIAATVQVTCTKIQG